MSFQDNSGDIILDAVLTNLGRRLLARGDGSFKVTRFALGDDEVNHGLYNTAASAATRDLKILQTPVFEASTNEATALRYRIISLEGKNNLLYLPVSRLNTKPKNTTKFGGFPFADSSLNDGTANQYVVLANQLAVDRYTGEKVSGDKAIPDGFIDGVNAKRSSGFQFIVEQGFDSLLDDVTKVIDPDLVEDQYIVQMDDRILKLASPSGQPFTESFIDTDNIASYVLPKVKNNQNTGFYVDGTKNADQANLGSITGPSSDQLRFSVYAASAVQNKSKLYSTIGVTRSGFFTKVNPTEDAETIDTVVRLTGNKTGMTLDIPVRVVRKSN
jgi:hypothetical protein